MRFAGWPVGGPRAARWAAMGDVRLWNVYRDVADDLDAGRITAGAAMREIRGVLQAQPSPRRHARADSLAGTRQGRQGATRRVVGFDGGWKMATTGTGRLPVVLAVAFLVGAGGWGLGCNVGPSKEPVPSAEAAKQGEAKRSPSSPIPIFITARRLNAEFGDNQLAADLKYRGQYVCVKGTVAWTGLDTYEDRPYVVLEQGVTCTLDKVHQKLVSEMRPDSAAEICGYVEPPGGLGIKLKGCTTLSAANRELRDQAVERYRIRAKNCPNLSEVLAKGTRREMAKCMKAWDMANDPEQVCRESTLVSGHNDPEVIKAKNCHYEACLAEGIGKDMCPMK